MLTPGNSSRHLLVTLGDALVHFHSTDVTSPLDDAWIGLSCFRQPLLVLLVGLLRLADAAVWIQSVLQN